MNPVKPCQARDVSVRVVTPLARCDPRAGPQSQTLRSARTTQSTGQSGLATGCHAHGARALPTVWGVAACRRVRSRTELHEQGTCSARTVPCAGYVSSQHRLWQSKVSSCFIHHSIIGRRRARAQTRRQLQRPSREEILRARRVTAPNFHSSSALSLSPVTPDLQYTRLRSEGHSNLDQV